MTLFEHIERYPAHPGYKDHDTSRQAAESMAPSAALLRRRCLESLKQQEGTADEIAERLNLTPFSVRPRFSELRTLGLIQDTGERRSNASGRSAKCWRAV